MMLSLRPNIYRSQEEKMGKGGGGDRSPNDQRSDSMNPNNQDYWDSLDNRSNQLNPNNPSYDSSRGDEQTDDVDDDV
jgi:hypothetical protein